MYYTVKYRERKRTSGGTISEITIPEELKRSLKLAVGEKFQIETTKNGFTAKIIREK